MKIRFFSKGSNHRPINKSPICACIISFTWYIIYVFQYQVLIVYGKQSKIVIELLVMKSNELQAEQITYFAKWMLSTVGKQWFIDCIIGTYICSTGAATNVKCYGKFEID